MTLVINQMLPLFIELKKSCKIIFTFPVWFANIMILWDIPSFSLWDTSKDW